MKHTNFNAPFCSNQLHKQRQKLSLIWRNLWNTTQRISAQFTVFTNNLLYILTSSNGQAPHIFKRQKKGPSWHNRDTKHHKDMLSKPLTRNPKIPTKPTGSITQFPRLTNQEETNSPAYYSQATLPSPPGAPAKSEDREKPQSTN